MLLLMPKKPIYAVVRARISGQGLLRAKFAVDARILVKNEDPKTAFRQVGFDPDRASAFEYCLRPSELFVEFRL